MGFPTTDQCPRKHKIEDRSKEKDKTHLSQACIFVHASQRGVRPSDIK